MSRRDDAASATAHYWASTQPRHVPDALTTRLDEQTILLAHEKEPFLEWSWAIEPRRQ
jgi:hypothetical protein